MGPWVRMDKSEPVRGDSAGLRDSDLLCQVCWGAVRPRREHQRGQSAPREKIAAARLRGGRAACRGPVPVRCGWAMPRRDYHLTYQGNRDGVIHRPLRPRRFWPMNPPGDAVEARMRAIDACCTASTGSHPAGRRPAAVNLIDARMTRFDLIIAGLCRHAGPGIQRKGGRKTWKNRKSSGGAIPDTPRSLRVWQSSRPGQDRFAQYKRHSNKTL
jgi:hypothetical protein